MARLIDSDALIKEITKLPFGDMSGEELAMAFYIHDMICDAPTIKAESVKRGKWVDGMPYTNSHWRVCSVCHGSAHHPAGGDNFCPKCGAKMEQEETW